MTPSPEILEMLDRLKLQRHLTSRELPPQKKDADGKKLCKWCDSLLPGRRRSWCSDECSEEFVIRFSSAHVRSKVYERDQGVCAECGIDTAWLARQYFRIHGRRNHRIEGIFVRRPEYKDFKKQWGLWHPGDNYTFWQADHIIPVAEGGGCCGMDNYQTLCTRCHKIDTKELAGRLASARKAPIDTQFSLDLGT